MKGDVRFESYGNGRLSVRMWWGGVECYLREIKQDPLRHFVLPALKASGNLPHSGSTEHRGGVRKRRGGWHYLAPGALCERGGHIDWLTDWLTTLHFKAPLLICAIETFFFFFFYKCLPMIYVVLKQTENSIRILFADILFSFHLLSVQKPQTLSSLEHWKRCPYFWYNKCKHREEHMRSLSRGLDSDVLKR